MNLRNMKSKLSNTLDNNKDIFIKKIESVGAKIGRILLAILVFLQSFIGYIPMMIVNAEEAEVVIEDGRSLKKELENPINSNKTLKLETDITVDSQINLIEGNYTIDLNGKSITSTVTSTVSTQNFQLFNIATNNVDFTIKNTSDEESKIERQGGMTQNNKAITVSSTSSNVKLTIDNVKISGFKYSMGGAIFVGGTDGSEPIVKITNSTFENNTAISQGGAICLKNAIAELTGNVFKNNNSSSQGGAIYAEGSNKNSKLKLEKNEFLENSSKRHGGAVYNKNNYIEIINENKFNNNKSSSGGALKNDSSNIILKGNTFNGNEAIGKSVDSQYIENGEGGAVYLSGHQITTTEDLNVYTATVENNYFQSNTANQNGGAIVTLYNINIFKGNTIQENKVESTKDTTSGGGIYSIGSSDSYVGNEILSNEALKGAGIYYDAGTPSNPDKNYRSIEFEDNKINGNIAVNKDKTSCENGTIGCGEGGGLYFIVNDKSKVEKIDFKSGEFKGNQATDGGAIYFGIPWKGSGIILKKALITGNTAARGGGIWLCPQAKTLMHSTLGGAVYGNKASGDVTFSWKTLNNGGSQTLKSAGDDIFYEGTTRISGITDLQYGPSESGDNVDSRTTLKVSKRTWSGHLIDWYKDEIGSRYADGNHDLADNVYLRGENSEGTNKLAALHGENSFDEDDALLVMSGNTATRRGGAIFTNNVIDLGVPEDIDITVNKKFIKGTKEYEGKKLLPDAVYVNLYRIDSNGSEELIEENVELSEDNDWSHTFVDLPSRDENGDFRYTVRESDESLLVDKTVDNGENGICKTDKNCNITLTNRVETPVKYQIEVEKEISGDTPIVNSDFIFKLNALNPSEGMILPKNLTTKVFGKGKAKFDEITFVDEGVYVFNVSEENTNNKYYKYDNSVYTVAIEVVSNEDNKKLEIGNVKITKNNNPDTLYENIKFTNKYNAPDIPIRINPDTVDKIIKYVVLFMLSIFGTFAIVVREYCFKK